MWFDKLLGWRSADRESRTATRGFAEAPSRLDLPTPARPAACQPQLSC